MNNASQAPAASSTSGATSLVDAVKNNQVTVTAQSWNAVTNLPNSQNPWLGTGRLQLTNKGNSAIQVVIPVGVLLQSPGNQDMIMFATNSQTQAASASTPAATSSATSTATNTVTTTTTTTTTTATQAVTPTATAQSLLPQTGADHPDSGGNLAPLMVLAGLALFGLGLLMSLMNRSDASA